MGQLKEVMPQDRLPIFVSAGVVKEPAQIERLIPNEAIAAQVLGSYTWNEHDGNDQNGRHNTFYYDAQARAAYNSIGLKNPGKENAGRYLPEVIKKMKAAGQLAIISVTTLKGEDPKVVIPRMVEWAVEMDADGVEVNGSCPNLDKDHPLLCDDADATEEMGHNTRSLVGYDFAFGYKVSDLPYDTAESIIRMRLFDFITTMNTKGNQLSPTNPDTGKPYIEVNDGYAGQSGPIIRGLARENLLKWVDVIRVEGSDEDILSVGGVPNGYEVYDRIANMGALMVGGAQEFYRAKDPRDVAYRWALGYSDAA